MKGKENLMNNSSFKARCIGGCNTKRSELIDS